MQEHEIKQSITHTLTSYELFKPIKKSSTLLALQYLIKHLHHTVVIYKQLCIFILVFFKFHYLMKLKYSHTMFNY